MSLIRPAPVLELSGAAAALAVGLAVAVTGVSYGLTGSIGIGPGFFPLVAGLLTAGGGALWLGRLLRARVTTAPPDLDTSDVLPEEEHEDVPDTRGWARIGVVVGALLAAALLLDVVGYTLSVTLMLTAVLTLVSRRRWWVALLAGVVAALASRLVFEQWLGTALPVSSLPLLSHLGL